MSAPAHDVCGGDHRIALVAMRDEALRYWKTTALLAATVAAGAGLTAPVLLLQGRLAPDMFNLIRQVQIATDQAKGGVARLAGQEPPKFDDIESSFADVKARIAKTIAFLNSFRPEQIDGSEARDITLSVGGETMKFKGLDYLLAFVTPNIYFHVTTTYAILRHNGLDVGKGDFLGSN